MAKCMDITTFKLKENIDIYTLFKYAIQINLMCYEKCHFLVEFDDILEWNVPSLLLFENSIAESLFFLLWVIHICFAL